MLLILRLIFLLLIPILLLLGLPLLLLGVGAIGYLTILWFLGLGPIGARPLLQIGILLTMTGVQVLGVGLIAELVQTTGLKERKTYFYYLGKKELQ